jgi:hypothetical protein
MLYYTCISLNVVDESERLLQQFDEGTSGIAILDSSETSPVTVEVQTSATAPEH